MELEVENAQLPSVLTITKFSAARGKEIQILNKALKSSSGINLAFQKLPKHMRRRAMSHNVKRLPRRLREIHLNQMTKSGLPPKQKRPSRKYRRRPYNLTSEYARRQRTHLWLNTHVWHAKRFHMIKKWGYQLPYSPCDRSFRACYRATMKHCLLQDITYCSCIELVGDINVLINGFEKITSTNIVAKSVVTGLRQSTLTLFDTLKHKPIGPVYFLWRPLSQREKKSLWLWIHPSYHDKVLDTLKEVFCINSCMSENNGLMYKGDDLEIKVLKYDLSRFRLTGPLSNVVLWNALKTADIKHMENEKNLWVKTFLESKQDYLSEIKERLNMFQFASSPAEFSPHIVLPFIIQDPRFNLPKKRTKAVQFYSDVSIETISWNKILENPLWEECFRKEAEQNKPSQATLAKLNEKLLVPGSAVQENSTVVPITLIQRPGKRSGEHHGYGSGWDIILPSAWAQPVWLSLVMWGARAGGLREMNSVTFETDQQQFLLPDTEAGRTEEKTMTSILKEKFFKLPPNKRPNFNKFGITSPFNWNWFLLLKEWGCTEDLASNFVVLRCKKLLENLQVLLRSKKPEMSFQEILENALVPVSLKFSQKGSCRQLAIICLPKSEDLSIVPVEPFHGDTNEYKRKQCRKEHKDLLKRLKRKRKQARINGEKIPIDMDLLKSYSTKMKQLWVPDTTAIRHSCSREVMGFVKHGDFSFLLAKTKGIGYITVNSLKKLLELKTDKVLIRNTSSRKYRLAVLDIITEV